MNNSRKIVFVCGDLVWDTHIARLTSDPKGYFQPHLQSQLTNRHGGAWYLRDVIEEALQAAKAEAETILRDRETERDKAPSNAPSPEAVANLENRVAEAKARIAQFAVELTAPARVAHVDIEEGKGNSAGIAKGFSVWEWFDGKQKTAKAKIDASGNIEFKWSEGEAFPGAWRVKEFLGCQAAKWPGDKGAPPACPAVTSIPDAPDLLVIDDLGLGFADHEDCWRPYLSASAKRILVKTTPPFDRPLWKNLLNPERAPKVTVIMAAAALRDAGAHLTRGLSWDLTIQEIKKEFAPGGIGWPLRNCERVILSFGRSGAAVFSRWPRSPREASSPPLILQFERFVYDPANLEETWSTDLPGKTFGASSAMTAAVAVQMLNSAQPSSHIMISRGLAAARELHRIGGGHSEKGFDLGAADAKMFHVDAEHLPENSFRSALPRELLDDPVLVKKEDLPAEGKQTLLTDALGLTKAFLIVAAEDIVRSGRERPLKSVPRLQYGKYFTVDREEIERLNTVRNLILDYQHNLADSRPLSIAVFGPPGAGKGFAIKELSESLFGKDRAVLEFNLSQFEGLHALHEAFHEVRDKSVQGKLPLVFWDEFDSVRDQTPLGWLKEFLAPMQDAQFAANGRAHPFGKCIFIFAGGTSGNFKEFIRPIDLEARPQGNTTLTEQVREKLEAEERRFREVKGTDFVSRLRGYVNIKGPNPGSEKEDTVHVIRRALMLRLLIERHHKELIHPVTKELVISPTVLEAFLRVGDGKAGQGYLHGARSMEAIVSLSRLRGCRRFGPSELPGQEVLDQHVTPDFMGKVESKTQYHLTADDIEKLAEKKHADWMVEKKTQGYIYGPLRDDNATPPTHPLLKPYAELDEKGKEGNRLPARLTALRLEALGFRICPADQATGEVIKSADKLLLKKLAQSEHRRWMREKLMHGYCHAEKTFDDLRLHKDIQKFADLPDQESKLDEDIVNAIFKFLEGKGLVLVRQGPQPNEK
jgi:hypothetical protein